MAVLIKHQTKALHSHPLGNLLAMHWMRNVPRLIGGNNNKLCFQYIQNRFPGGGNVCFCTVKDARHNTGGLRPWELSHTQGAVT